MSAEEETLNQQFVLQVGGCRQPPAGVISCSLSPHTRPSPSVTQRAVLSLIPQVTYHRCVNEGDTS